MMAQAPIPQPTNFLTTAEVRSASEQLQQEGYQVVREIFLRRLVDGSIKENGLLGVTTGVSIVDLSSHRLITSHNQDTEQFAASINKLPVSLLLLEDLRTGRLSLDQTLTWTTGDRRGGFGDFDQPDTPLSAPLRDVLYDLLNKSGNTAVRILVNGPLGGAAAVNERWARMPELSHTRLQPLDPNRFYLGNSTPHDSLWTMGKLMEQQDQYAGFMKDAMAANIFEDFGVRSQLAGTDFVVLVNKIGLLDDIEGNNRHDVGAIYNEKTGKTYAYSFMTTAPYDAADPTATQRAEQSLREMGRATLRFAGSNKAYGSPESGTWSKRIEGRVLY